MTDYRHELQFGVFITPMAEQADEVVELARLADVVGLDLVTSRITPTRRSSSTPGRCSRSSPRRRRTSGSRRTSPTCRCGPPIVLARSVASLDILSRGRVKLGLGAGAFWDAIAANGGPRLTPGRASTR